MPNPISPEEVTAGARALRAMTNYPATADTNVTTRAVLVASGAIPRGGYEQLKVKLQQMKN